MPNETEKLTINLGVVELAQIDVLVEQGLYANRSDFIRTSVRKQLEYDREKVDFHVAPVSSKKEWTKSIGILTITKRSLEKLAKENEQLNIHIIGMLIIDTNISTELFEKTVDQILIKGKIIASDEIKSIIEDMN